MLLAALPCQEPLDLQDTTKQRILRSRVDLVRVESLHDLGVLRGWLNLYEKGTLRKIKLHSMEKGTFKDRSLVTDSETIRLATDSTRPARHFFPFPEDRDEAHVGCMALGIIPLFNGELRNGALVMTSTVCSNAGVSTCSCFVASPDAAGKWYSVDVLGGPKDVLRASWSNNHVDHYIYNASEGTRGIKYWRKDEPTDLEEYGFASGVDGSMLAVPCMGSLPTFVTTKVGNPGTAEFTVIPREFLPTQPVYAARGEAKRSLPVLPVAAFAALLRAWFGRNDEIARAYAGQLVALCICEIIGVTVACSSDRKEYMEMWAYDPRTASVEDGQGAISQRAICWIVHLLTISVGVIESFRAAYVGLVSAPHKGGMPGIYVVVMTAAVLPFLALIGPLIGGWVGGPQACLNVLKAEVVGAVVTFMGCAEQVAQFWGLPMRMVGPALLLLWAMWTTVVANTDIISIRDYESPTDFLSLTSGRRGLIFLCPSAYFRLVPPVRWHGPNGWETKNIENVLRHCPGTIVATKQGDYNVLQCSNEVEDDRSPALRARKPTTKWLFGDYGGTSKDLAMRLDNDARLVVVSLDKGFVPVS